MTSEPTGGSTTHKSTEWCRYLREKKGLVSTMPSEARNFAAIADHIATLTAENERLSARVARLENAGNALIDYVNKPETPSMTRQIYVLLDQLLAAIEDRTARRELEEGK